MKLPPSFRIPLRAALEKKGFRHVILQASDRVDYDEAHITEGDVSAETIGELRLLECVVEGVLFDQTHVEEGKVVNCVFEKCSFAGAELLKMGLDRVRIQGARMPGLQMYEAHVVHTHVVSSKLTTANFRAGTFSHVCFERCDLTEVDFLGAKLTDVIFHECTLSGAQFSHAQLTNVRFKGSTIEGIHIDRDAFHAVTVDSAQALYLASLFGLTIED